MGDYSDYLTRLKKIARRKKIRLRKIGAVGAGKELPLYAMVLRGKRPKRIVCFTAGVHGDEASGPAAILEFLKRLKPNQYSNLKVIIFPVANPYGFERGIRRNYRGWDLNRHFGDKILKDENKILYAALGSKQIFLFLSLHEDDVNRGFYLSTNGDRSHHFYRLLLESVGKVCPIVRRGKVYASEIREGQVVEPKRDGSFEDRMDRDGVAIAFAAETPDFLPKDKMIKVNLTVLMTALKFVNEQPSR